MGGKEAPERIKRAEKKGREQRGKGQATGRQDTQIRYQTGHNPVKGEGGSRKKIFWRRKRPEIARYQAGRARKP